MRDLLYAYIDGDLPAEEQAAVRRHLHTCPDCRGDFIELKATRQLLKSLPAVEPPRAFTLTPEMAGAVKQKPSFWGSLLMPRNAPRFAFGSVLSLVIMLLVLFAGPVGREMALTSAGSAASVPQAGMRSADTQPSTYSKQATEPTQSPVVASSAAPAAPSSGGGAAGMLPEGTPAPAEGQGQASSTGSAESAQDSSATASTMSAPAQTPPPGGELSTGHMENPTTTALNPEKQPFGDSANAAAASSSPSRQESGGNGTGSGPLAAIGVALGLVSALLAVFAVISARKSPREL